MNNIMLNCFKHIITIIKHKHYVFINMTKCGYPIRGLLHDMSKFSFVEFSESVKFFQGNRSPIEAAKEDHGYSLAWLHHRGRNPHHSQYWCDISFGKVIPCEIPFKYLVELICDGIAAGKVYMGKKWNNDTPLEYWLSKDCKSFYNANTKVKLFQYYTDISKFGWNAVADKIRKKGDYNA